MSMTLTGPLCGPESQSVVVHLAASPFFGGPERQMLGLATHLPASCRSVFLSFAEGGRAQPFLDQVAQHGFEAVALNNNFPHLLRCAAEVAGHLRRVRANVLICHNYKPNLVGLMAAHRLGIPVVSVSRGWTAATSRVRLYEAMDRRCLRWMDQVVCVSEGQAAKVRRRAGVPDERVVVIRNAIQPERFSAPDPAYRQRLAGYFAVRPQRIVCAVGRLSPEKGFDQLVAAAALVQQANSGTAFVLFGDGPLREALVRQIDMLGLAGSFVLAGFREDVDKFLPHADLVALPSFTEGLPNIALEALAAAVPVVATAVGGTPEVVEHGTCGYLVRPGDPPAMADRILALLADEQRRREMGMCGRQRIEKQFTFVAQARAYQRLFERLTGRRVAPLPAEAGIA